ncbi:MAG: hypothetical protein L0H15_00205 [Nitrosospira sp.]|nr:hypothetical protein [Nitrosospira sp.]MDN5881283.1 hypothetical protein [Nitrosospira sp.]
MQRIHLKPIVAFTLALMLLMIQSEAHAIRPFVTDDARVVGARLGQVESWFVLDRQESAHNTLFAIGATNWLEITSGFTHGGGYRGAANDYGITGGILQAKALIRETRSNEWPGVAFAAGVVPPFGSGSVTPDAAGVFGYTALSQSFFNDDLLLHVNLGVATIKEEMKWKQTLTAGFGFQAKVIGNFHAVGEVYHGDPYDPRMRDMASQVGFRHIFGPSFQLDGTVGSTLDNNPHSQQWFSIGVRIVSPELW